MAFRMSREEKDVLLTGEHVEHISMCCRGEAAHVEFTLLFCRFVGRADPVI